MKQTASKIPNVFLIFNIKQTIWIGGQSQTIWWHQLQSGALLLFTFFMISDPMTIPNRQCARIVYAIAVAG